MRRLATVVILGDRPRVAVTEALIEAPRAVVLGAHFEAHVETTSDDRHGLDPVHEQPTDPTATILRTDGEQVDVRSFGKVTSDHEADDHIAIAGCGNLAVGITNVAGERRGAPSVVQPVLDEQSRHLGERRGERHRRGPDLHQRGHEGIMAYRVTGSATPW